jgi:prophage DNA circulation protein
MNRTTESVSMSRVFKLRYRTLFAASLALALASLGFYLYPARLAGQVTSGTDSHPIRELQEERLATLWQLADFVDQKRRQGSASMAEVASAKREVAEAELEICANQTDRLRILQKIVEDTRILASQAAQLAQNNLASQEVALAMKADLLRSQIRLELARAELSSELNGSGQKRAPAGWASRARNDVPLTRGERVP